tara:strand:- start:754 stop:1191 length:438 start_codon:yes stop_codon:yes gene_type:complete
MIKLKIKANVSKATRYLKKLVRKTPSATQRALKNTGLMQLNIIKKRTNKGRGVLGAFKKYTPEYEKFKVSIGQGRTPNLQVSNFMLSNMNEKTNKRLSRLHFPNNKANELAFYNDKTRPFFSVTSKEERLLQRNFEKQLTRFMGI